MSKDSKFFLKALIFFFILIFGFSGFSRAISGTNLPFAVVMSGSMEPTIPTGSLLFIQKISGADIVAGTKPIGDVIVFNLPGTKITDYFLFAVYDPVPWSHRAIDKKEIAGKYYILTKGDANANPDENPYNPTSWVPEDRVIGRVIWYAPYLGYLFIWLKNPFVIAGIVLTLIILIILPTKNDFFRARTVKNKKAL
ncbi:MAG: signal peptidase I [Candidatus Methanomethylicaceae archaeon]